MKKSAVCAWKNHHFSEILGHGGRGSWGGQVTTEMHCIMAAVPRLSDCKKVKTQQSSSKPRRQCCSSGATGVSSCHDSSSQTRFLSVSEGSPSSGSQVSSGSFRSSKRHWQTTVGVYTPGTDLKYLSRCRAHTVADTVHTLALQWDNHRFPLIPQQYTTDKWHRWGLEPVTKTPFFVYHQYEQKIFWTDRKCMIYLLESFWERFLELHCCKNITCCFPSCHTDLNTF